VNRKVICALDTGDVAEAIKTVKSLSDHVLTFKIGHALTLTNGLDVIARLKDAGAQRIFLDLKFHDIPSVVALAVREAAKCGVWMTTVHVAGGRAMMTAAVEQSRAFDEEDRPLLMGVSVLTSLSQRDLTEDLGVTRDLPSHMVQLSQLAIDCELDGVIASPHEAGAIRMAIGHEGIIVTPGIQLNSSESSDQTRVADAQFAFDNGADYVVIGRALTSAEDPRARLEELGLTA
jgi:orotidine-5'-phosphate decarboxylase